MALPVERKEVEGWYTHVESKPKWSNEKGDYIMEIPVRVDPRTNVRYLYCSYRCRNWVPENMFQIHERGRYAGHAYYACILCHPGLLDERRERRAVLRQGSRTCAQALLSTTETILQLDAVVVSVMTAGSHRKRTSPGTNIATGAKLPKVACGNSSKRKSPPTTIRSRPVVDATRSDCAPTLPSPT